MNIFLKRLVLFVTILVLYFGVCFVINKTMLLNSKVLEKGSNILINGDSHMEVAINPELFNSAINIAQGGENIVLSYWKLKYLTKNISFDTLMFSFSYNNISKMEEGKFYGDKMTPEVMRRSILIGDFNTIDTILNVDYKEYYKSYFRQMCLYPKKDQYTFIGGFNPSDYSNLLPNAERRIEKHYRKKQQKADISEVMISYLDSIVKLCKQNKITPILVSTPLHKTYFDKIPLVIKEGFEAKKSELIDKNIIFLDFSDNFMEDEFYYDCDHLNRRGAEKFTKILVDELNK